MNKQLINNIEVEVRGLLTKAKYSEIITFLKSNAEHKELDNKTSYFFVIEGGILKINDEVSKNKAEISYKFGDESKNILEEFEIPIARSAVEKTIKIFQHLGLVDINVVQQKRVNFLYKGVEFSIKDTPDFGPHFEAETMATNQEDAANKRKTLVKLCKLLDLQILSEQEIKDLIVSINTKHGFIKNE
jgi:adenylate cyclase class IV